jgi:ubiquinol-cytochrome c reductase iron-sulfur subunit
MTSDRVAGGERRRLYLIGGLCALGAGLGVARYVVTQPQPPAGNPLAVDFGNLPPGKLLTVDWGSRTVWILRRSADEIAALAGYESELTDPASLHSLQPAGCRNPHRSLRPEIFVAIGQCTHQGCPPALRSGAGNRSEFLCPCHTSKFDLAGRVFRMGPAPANLVIPEYRLEGDSRVVIGES